MKKRYVLSQKVIDHIFKIGSDKTNDGAGGHSTVEMDDVTEYKITHIPVHKKDEADNWKRMDLAEAKRCPFPHVATYKRGARLYNQKSMFPGNVKKADLIKTIERALTSPSRGHTYAKTSSPMASDKTRQWINPNDWKRQITDNSISGGDYVKGRANGIIVIGQVKGHGEGEDLTSAFPHTVGFHKIQ